MADVAEEVVQHLKNLQAADDARRLLSLRYVDQYSGNSCVVTLGVENRDGRKLYVSCESPGFQNTFLFQAMELGKAVALFSEIGRQQAAVLDSYALLEIYDKSNGDMISRSVCNLV